jgi:hypothetical protein
MIDVHVRPGDSMFILSEAIKKIYNHSVFQPKTLGPGLHVSFPILHRSETETLVSFFVYRLDLYRFVTLPRYRFLVALEPSVNLQAIPIESPKDIGLNIEFFQGRGQMIHPLYKLRPNYRGIPEQVSNLVGQLMKLYPKAPSLLTQSERSVVEEYANFFNSSAEELFVPAFRSISPEFFEWIEEVLQGTSTFLSVDPHFALRKMHAFNQLVILPAFTEIKATLEQDNKDVMIISGSSTGDAELDKNFKGMHPGGHWLGGTEYYFSDAVDLCT